MSADDLRAVIGGLVRQVHPVDPQEAGDQADILGWKELGIRASFHLRAGAGLPFFLTANPTREKHSHVDVSKWFVLDCGRDVELRPDPREFRSVRWYNVDDQPEWPADRFDPQMARFISKLKAALPRDPLHDGSPTL